VGDRERAEVDRLMALAVGSPYSEEGRTAAMAAVKRIMKYDLLVQAVPSPTGLAAPPEVDAAREREIENLRREVARLKAAKRQPTAVAASPAALDVVDKLREIERLRAEVARLRAMVSPVHVVQPDESMASIAQLYTGSWGRFPELVMANPHKPIRVSPWGVTFESLSVGERLRLPPGW